MNCRTVAGFTLVEMTIAITIMAVTALAVAGVTMAISKAQSDTETYYQSIQTGRSSIMKLQNIVQSAKLVTYCSTTRIILWLEDTNGDGDVNLEEIGVIEFSSGKVTFYRPNIPTAMEAIMDVRVPLNDMVAVGYVNQIITNQYVSPVVLAEDVSTCQFVATPTPPYAKLVRIQMTIGYGPEALTLRTAASTRAGLTKQVSYLNTQYVFVPG